MTRKKTSAHQANGKLSHGLATPEGREDGFAPPTSATGFTPSHPLQNILNRQVEICKAQRRAILKEPLAGPSPYERAAEIALVHPNAALMQRMEESSFRQIWRITTLLLKVQSQAREEESGEMPPGTCDVYERKAS